MATENGQDSVLGFRPTPALRSRLEAARPACAEDLDVQASSVSWQLLLPWLLNKAMDQLGIPRANGSESDALSTNAEAPR